MQTILTADIVSAVFLALIMFGIDIRKNDASKSAKSLLMASMSCLLCCVYEAVSILLLKFNVPYGILYVYWMLLYLGGNVSLFLFVKYCFEYISERTNVGRLFFYIPSFLLLVSGVNIVIAVITGKIFIIEAGKIIFLNSLPLSVIVIQIFIIIYLPLFSLLQWKKIGLRSVVFLGLFGVFPLINSLVQYIFNCDDYSYAVGAFAVGIIIILFGNKNSMEAELQQKQMLIKKNEALEEKQGKLNEYMNEQKFQLDEIRNLNGMLKESNKKLEERFNIIQTMGSIYFASYYIDLANDSYIELSSMGTIRQLIKSQGKVQESVNLTCEKLIEPEFKDVMKKFLDFSTIQERLRVKNVVSQRYVGVSSGWSIAYLIAGDRDHEGKLRHIFFATRTIHVEKAEEDAKNKKLAEYNEIITNAGLGLWNITLKDGLKPRMEANEKMRELLGISSDDITDEQIYANWYERILPEALPSVLEHVSRMQKGEFAENTYLWNHPQKGNIYVRCGGIAENTEDGTCIISGYHADVTSIVMEAELERLKNEFEKNEKQLTKMNLFLLDALGTVVEFRSLESGDHVKRVMTFTKLVLERIKEKYPVYELTDKKIELMAQAAALHDVGKIAIPDEILKAPRKLTAEEFEEMKKHTIFGCEILEKFKFMDNDFYKYCYEICRWHHEKADGKGYPDGLVKEEIPIYCQATAIADCFDALVSKRVYKDSIACEEAFDMIVRGECGQFSEELLDCFKLAKKDLFSFVIQD